MAEPVSGSNQCPAGFVYLPEGTFKMGSERGVYNEYDEKPAHEVALSAFCLQATEVTQEQYDQYVNFVKSYFPFMADYVSHPFHLSYHPQTPDLIGPRKPKIGITWEVAKSYCEWRGWRLATEAEWEYAARGPSHDYALNMEDINHDNAVYGDDNQAPAEVCSKAGHYVVWGGKEICDLHGNAIEWVADSFQVYEQHPQGTVKNPFYNRPAVPDARVLRGGAFDQGRWRLRSTARERGLCYDTVMAGIRCAVSPQGGIEVSQF